MKTRRFFLPSMLLALLFTEAVLAGQYQLTKDKITLVWNEDHKRGELVSWSGKRDADGYATGYGTLTWYAPAADQLETGSNLPRQHFRVLSRVSGTMVHGKFAEASPSARSQPPVEPAKPKRKGWLSSIFKPRQTPTPPPVEATPTPKSRSTHNEETAQKPTPAPTEAAASPTPTSTPSPKAADHSLDSLMHAPSSLKLNSPTPSPSPAIPSPAAMPDLSLQPAQPTSPSPTP